MLMIIAVGIWIEVTWRRDNEQNLLATTWQYSWSLESCFVAVDGICCRQMLVTWYSRGTETVVIVLLAIQLFPTHFEMFLPPIFYDVSSNPVGHDLLTYNLKEVLKMCTTSSPVSCSFDLFSCNRPIVHTRCYWLAIATSNQFLL